MSTGVVAPPLEQHEDWWDSGQPRRLDSANMAKSKQPGGKVEISRRSAVAVLEDALDLAVEAGLDWQKRQAIDALITRAFQSPEIPQAEITGLLNQWETETGRFGSVQAAKKSDAYQSLLRMDSEAVIRAALKRLAVAPSTHLLMLLQERAGAVPAVTETTVTGASAAWLDWGKRQGMA